MLMLASRLPGQTPANGEDWDGQIVACNDGTITFNVAQAYLYSKSFSGYQWQASGWFKVAPGKCQEIPSRHYHNGGWGSKDSYTLLAFEFYDSTGTWGGVRISPGDNVFHASNQQFCVKPLEAFEYARDSPQGDLPRVCDGAQTGYQMIPASFEYTGRLGTALGYDWRNELHIKLGPNDRAIPLGKQTSSDAQSAVANPNHNPPPPPVAPRIVVSPAPAPPQRPHPAPIMVGKADVSHLAGLLLGDSREYVSYILGPPTADYAEDSSAFGGYPYTRDDGLSMRVNYRNNLVESVKVYSKGSRGTDPLLDLLGKSEAAAVAMLGPPKTRESLWNIDDTDLVWSFPLGGRPADRQPNPQAIQTLTLHFKKGVGCQYVAVQW
jgi:hypothetical protein